MSKSLSSLWHLNTVLETWDEWPYPCSIQKNAEDKTNYDGLLWRNESGFGQK